MLYNKNNVRKTNDKKILHKVGKQWKVVSVALLMAIGGAAVATHANADEVAGTQPYDANQAQFKQPVQKNKTVKPASSEGIHYYPAASGAAASYFDKVESDNGVASKQYNTVNRYVQSLNAEYGPQVHSLSAKTASASDAASNDTSLANSYSAENLNGNTGKVISSLAAKNHMNSNVYEDMVQGNEQSFSNEVNSASADVKANSDVASIVNKFEGTDFSAASLSASESAGRAESNYYAAKYNRDSVYARYGEGDNTAASYIDAANKLSADAKVLLANGNEPGQGYEYDLLTQAGDDEATGNVTGADAQASLRAAISSDADEVLNGYKNAYYSDVSNVNSLSNFASTATYNEVPNATGYFSDNLRSDNSSLEDEFNNAVSEAANLRMGEFTSSVANSLNANYRGQYAGYNANASEASAAKASASAALRSAGYAYDFADANNNIIDQASDDVQYYVNGGYDGHHYTSADAKASVAYSYLAQGVNNTADHFNVMIDPNVAVHNESTISNQTDFINGLDDTLTGNQKALFDDIKGDLNYSGDTADVQNQIDLAISQLNKMITGLNDQYNSDTVSPSNAHGVPLTSAMISGGTAHSHDINSGQFSSVVNLLNHGINNDVAKDIMNHVVPSSDRTGSINDVANDISNNMNDLYGVANAVNSISSDDASDFGLSNNDVRNTHTETTDVISHKGHYENSLEFALVHTGLPKKVYNAIKSDLTITNDTTRTDDVYGQITGAIAKLQNAVKALSDQNNAASVSTEDGIDFTTSGNELNGSTAHSYTVKNTSSALTTALKQGNTIAGDVLGISGVINSNDNITKTAANISNMINGLQKVADYVYYSPEYPNYYGLNVHTVDNAPNYEWEHKDVTTDNDANDVYFDGTAALLSDGVDFDQLEAESGAINNVASAVNSAAANSQSVADATTAFDNELNVAASSANSALDNAKNASASDSAANDEDVTLAGFYAKSYSDDASAEYSDASADSVATNKFFKNMADDATFNSADDTYSDAEAAAASDKKIGEEYSAVVFNNSPHFLDVLKGAKLHSSYEYGSQYDKILGTVNKGDRLTVLGVNFDRQGNWRGQTHYLVLDNNTGKKGFFTGQSQYSKRAYLDSILDYNNVNVSVKTLKPVTVRDNINGGNVVKTLPAGTTVNNVTIVNDNPENDAQGYTKVEDSNDNFFTANTDYVQLIVAPKNNDNNNNNNNNFNFNLNNVNLDHAYDNKGRVFVNENTNK